jgi:hypothetical protein
MPEAASGGILIRANNGHITRGGEFEQRAAFVPTYDLPDGTVGMFYDPAGIKVFGSDPAPSGLPTGVTYQQLQHPMPPTALVRVLSTDLYAGKIYAVGEFADGSIHHFYDGVRVTDWFDGRARATFEVTGGVANAAIPATGTMTVTGGTAGAGNAISAVLIDGVDALGATVLWATSNAVTAANIATQINAFTSIPDYTATSTGAVVTITPTTPGAAANGRVINPTVTGTATATGGTLSGGADTATSQVIDLKINGVSVISAPVNWTTSNEASASALAAAINGFTSTPDYTASAAGSFVSIAAVTPGPAPNGFVGNFTLANGYAVNPITFNMANGADSTNTYQPGRFVKTIGKKVYSVSGPNMHFSGVAAPTKWTTDAVGAGFVDMSTESSGSEELTALARYQNFAAIFAARTIQIWYVDPDPALNRQNQVLSNTGTESPRSVTSFGDVDIFYLADSGLRSLRSRDLTSSAATTDIGVPVDDLIIAKVATLTENERQRIIGLIEPRDGRFWLIMKDQIFVFSFFTGAKVSAWSTYNASYTADDEEVPLNVNDATVFRRRVYLRSGDRIYVYGGLETGDAHDTVEAEAWLPYLDGDDPTAKKAFVGLDLAIRGQWSVAAAMDPTNPSAEDKVGIYDRTTYNDDRSTFSHRSTHISLRFRSQGPGPHRLGACVVHYDPT